MDVTFHQSISLCFSLVWFWAYGMLKVNLETAMFRNVYVSSYTAPCCFSEATLDEFSGTSGSSKNLLLYACATSSIDSCFFMLCWLCCVHLLAFAHNFIPTSKKIMLWQLNLELLETCRELLQWTASNHIYIGVFKFYIWQTVTPELNKRETPSLGRTVRWVHSIDGRSCPLPVMYIFGTSVSDCAWCLIIDHLALELL